jgi:chromosome partitioning related protein ParA
MQAISIVSTKGGVGKTTVAANLGGFFADAGLRVLLIDADTQPSLSSYYHLTHQAPCGLFELLTRNESNLEQVISRTDVKRLEIIFSNDPHHQLNTLLLNAPDGRVRLRNLMPLFEPHYDAVVIDTQGARSVLLEAAVLASALAITPVMPEVLSAIELDRGTLQLMKDILPYRYLGIEPPALSLLINRVPTLSKNARAMREELRLTFGDLPGIRILETEIPAIEVFQRAATERQAAHRLEPRRPTGRIAPSALEIVQGIAIELFPQWREQCAQPNLTRTRLTRGHEAKE